MDLGYPSHEIINIKVCQKMLSVQCVSSMSPLVFRSSISFKERHTSP